MQYTDYGQMCVQFEEIFIERNYAFCCDNDSPCIVDCGGNMGLSAVWFKLHYPRCRLRVYEADPQIAEILSHNLAPFPDVCVDPAAVWTGDGPVRFEARGNDSGRIDPGGAISARAIDLARELPARVDLLKLDIEGAEYAVLNHLCDRKALERVEAIVAEFHVWRTRTDELLSTLAHLRAEGMEFCFKGSPSPWIGRADEAAPFEAVGNRHLLMMLYAWWPHRHAGRTAIPVVSPA